MTDLTSDLQRLNLAKEAATLITERTSLDTEDTRAVMRSLQIGKRLREIGMQLGIKAPSPATEPEADPEIEGEMDSDPGDEFSDDPNSPNYRYKDTGYIADSRKEKAASMIATAKKTGARLRATDIDWDAIEQNPRQAADLVTKSNLFGKTDWERLQEAGMDPAAGFLIDKVYASIGPGPATDGALSRKDYAFGLETIRDRLENKLAVAEVLDVLDEIRDELKGAVLNAEEADESALLQAERQTIHEREREIRTASDELYNRAQSLRGDTYRAEHELDNRKKRGWKVDPKQEQAYAEAKALDDVAWKEWGGNLAATKSEREQIERRSREIYQRLNDIASVAKRRNLLGNPVTRAWLTFGERFFKLLHFRSFKGSDSFAGHVTNAKSGKITDWSWADKERPSAPKDATKQEINFQMKVAESYERKGGKLVSANSTQALKDMLGFRDIQSGNWVLKDPNSAKFHVENTAAAMSDLSDIVGVDMGLLGFGGRLGMAFGARGSGGKDAPRAHYEPVQRVINLTKMGGGGALAHEYFHALDNVMHELVNEKVSGSKKDFVTLMPELLPEGGLRDAVHGLRSAILTGTHRSFETIKFTEKDTQLAKYNIDNPRNRVSKAVKEAGNATDAILAIDPFFPSRDNKRVIKQRNQWRKLAAAFYAQPGELSARLKVGAPVSSYAMEASRLDDGEMGKYWSQTEEMAARAFQAWTEDRLAGQDRKNDYLSAFADNKYHVDPLFGIEWKPFPDGEERAVINAAFDRLFEEIRKQQVFEKANANKTLLDAVFSQATAEEEDLTEGR
jgi:hypothetical protein